MGKLSLDQADYLFHSDALRDPTLRVVRFTGREAISQPFEFCIELVSEDSYLDLDAAIGQPACLTLRGRLPDGSRYSRYVHGVIESFTQIGVGIRQSRYEALLVPMIRPLHYTRNSRIFQNLSTPDVILKILADDQVPGDYVQSMLHATYGPRDYCVQYQESDLAFITRLWEEEGISYFFEHQKDQGTLTVGDGNHAFASLPEYSTVALRDKPHLYEEGLHELRVESAFRSGAAALRDFKFKQPGLDMEASAQSAKFSNYEMYYFPGEYVDPAMGKRLARVRLEEQQCQKNRYTGRGNVRAMLPGHKFTLAGHRRRDYNQEYLIVAIEHEGTQPGALGEEGSGAEKGSYQNRIEAIPAGVTFRPKRETPTPSIPGVQTAIVVGPPGEEIHCDSHGRVKVQFHWDRQGLRDDNSSCWVRVSQVWGGAGQGGMFIPRVGQEVVVQFLEGDPDRPLITGRVYNGENPVPHGLPAAKHISTIRSSSTPGGGGYNELRFDDTAGNEEVFFHAQFNHNEIIEGNHNATVNINETVTIVGSGNTTILSSDTNLTIGGDKNTTIGGEEKTTVGGEKKILIGGKEYVLIDGENKIILGKEEIYHFGPEIAFTLGPKMETTIGGEISTLIGGGIHTTIGGEISTTIGGEIGTTIGGEIKTLIGGGINTTIGGEINTLIGGGVSTTIGGEIKTILGGEINTTIGGAINTTIGGEINTVLGGSVNTTIGAELSIIAGADISLVAGAALDLVGGAAIDVSAMAMSVTGVSIDIAAAEFKNHPINLGSGGDEIHIVAIVIFL